MSARLVATPCSKTTPSSRFQINLVGPLLKFGIFQNPLHEADVKWICQIKAKFTEINQNAVNLPGTYYMHLASHT